MGFFGGRLVQVGKKLVMDTERLLLPLLLLLLLFLLLLRELEPGRSKSGHNLADRCCSHIGLGKVTRLW